MLRIIAAVLWGLALVFWAISWTNPQPAPAPSGLASRASRLCHLLATACIILSWWVVF